MFSTASKRLGPKDTDLIAPLARVTHEGFTTKDFGQAGKGPGMIEARHLTGQELSKAKRKSSSHARNLSDDVPWQCLPIIANMNAVTTSLQMQLFPEQAYT